MGYAGNRAWLFYAALVFGALSFETSPSAAAGSSYDCSGCHNMPPLDASYRNISTGAFKGNHSTHNPASVAPAASCEKCHPGSTSFHTGHRDGFIAISSNINASPHPSGGSYDKPRFFQQTSSPILSSCANVNCHFESVTPIWGSNPSDTSCSTCHGAPPADGSHPKHVMYYSGLDACSKCHTDHTAEVSRFAHATSVGNRPLAIQFVTAPNSGGNYSGNVSYPVYLPSSNPARDGSCTGLYCHSDGGGGGPKVVPTWGGSLDCNGCHHSTVASGTPIQSGKHEAHINTAAAISGNYGCVECHARTVTGDMTIFNINRHVDGFVDFSGAKAGKNLNSTTGACSMVYCHSDGRGNYRDMTLTNWKSAATLDCRGCHDSTAVSGAPIVSGKHGAHIDNAGTLASNYRCVECHAKTVGDDTAISTPARHIDGFVDFSGARAGRSITSATGVCSTVYCHSDGKGTYKDLTITNWKSAATLDCTGCHGADAAPAFGSAAGEPNYASSGAAELRSNNHKAHAKGAADCVTCHVNTVDGTGRLTGSAHTDGTIDVIFNQARAGVGITWTAGTKSCADISCHLGSSAVWGGSMAADCTGCHGNDAASSKPTVTGKHRAHMNNYSTLGLGNNYACVECHASTVAGNRAIGTLANHANSLKNYSGVRAGAIAAAGSGQCANNYCHSTGMKNNQFWDMTSASWYSDKKLSCNGCHGTAILPNRTSASFDSVAGEPSYANSGQASLYANSHEKHVSGMGFSDATGCAGCHARTVNAEAPNKFRDYSTLHLDGSRDVTFSTKASSPGVQGRYSSTNQQCINTYCHGSASKPTWGGPALECNACHSAENTGFTANAAGSHARHYESATVPASGTYASMPPVNAGTATKYQFNCTVCHATPAIHSNGQVDAAAGQAAEVHFGYTTATLKGTYVSGTKADSSDNGFNWTQGQCTSVYCHSNGAGGAPLVTPVVWGGTTTCRSCHDGPGNKAAPTALSGKHFKHTGYDYGFTCDKCHLNTATGSSTIKNKVLHVNKTKDVAFAQGVYSSSAGNKGCTNTYCHSDALGNPPTIPVKWSDTGTMKCYSCHKGRNHSTDPSLNDNTPANCVATGGTWIPNSKNALTGANDVGICSPFLTMTSNGHERLVGPGWIRQYACTFCHAGTVTSVPQGAGNPPKDGPIIPARHVNYSTNVVLNPFWNIAGGMRNYSAATYNPVTKVCANIYCHSDGTVDPDVIRDFPWNWRENGSRKHAECNACHGHPKGDCTTNCHDNKTKYVINNISTVLSYPQTAWAPVEEWKAAMPMYPNGGVGSTRANSHTLHVEGRQTITCSDCHYLTIPTGDCTNCHTGTVPGGMGETAHLDPTFHVNKKREVTFKSGGTYNSGPKSCQNTDGVSCHGSNTPKWGDSKDNSICLTCHGTTNGDTDNYAFSFNNTEAKINLTEWKTTGHGRMSSATSGPSGRYPSSNNPAANFPGNPCWYCHDSKVMHNYSGNIFRLKMHNQFSNRFEKECVYCHMQGTDSECLSCHNVDQATGRSMAPQLLNITSSGTRIPTWNNNSSVHFPRPDHRSWSASGGSPSCLSISYNGVECHYVDPGNSKYDVKLHNSGAGFWSAAQKSDVKNLYMSMGVCLQCHDDDSNNKCTECHLPPPTDPKKYAIGYDPGTGFIRPKKARASSVHFGIKHYRGSMLTGGVDANGKATGTWKGGKFCWDCHDPHGDKNIYMVHDQVATQTDGRFGIPKERKPVVFTQKITGSDYAQKTAPQGGTITGICNVCHSTASRHYRATGGDSHNSNTVCTSCHEHRFSDSHAEGESCNSCHKSKPVPRHSSFGLPRDCLKCHTGSVGNRVDIIGQFKGNSHHVQGVPISNRHCYQCHWESTPEGFIDPASHEGFNFKNYSTQKDTKVDLVIYGPGTRPTLYRLYSSSAGRATAVQFVAATIGGGDANAERKQSAGINNHCLGCHSDQNNDTKPFDDCKTPRQYAWDRQSIDARYSQKGVTRWGKYSSATVNAKYKVTKALSAHGNAGANQGGWNPSTGTDTNINNYRIGFAGMSSARRNVQCFDCHNSHGSKAAGVTSSYVSYSGTRGGNIKEVTMGKGGYKVTYFAKANVSGNNPYNAGAAQCFDCHMTAMKGEDWTNGTPWGYQSTYGATQPIKGYRDGYRFGDRTYVDPYAGPAYLLANDFKRSKGIIGGHLKATSGLKTHVAEDQQINGLCTPCHDPHGVSPVLGAKQQYGVPLLKDTWMSSPYKEDYPPPDPYGKLASSLMPSWSASVLSGSSLNIYGANVITGRESSGAVQPFDLYRIDRNTFGGSSRIAEDDSNFAGLCTKCHSKQALLGRYSSSQSPNSAPWKSVERIHASTKGWGANKEHSFTCSKCHQPHNSGLPRLMQTDCLDYQHRGMKVSGGVPWSALKSQIATGSFPHYRTQSTYNGRLSVRGYPSASEFGIMPEFTGQGNIGKPVPQPDASVACHVSRFTDLVNGWKSGVSGQASGVPEQWPDGNFWNSVTPWPMAK